MINVTSSGLASLLATPGVVPPSLSPPRPVPSAVRILMPAVLSKDAN